MKKEYFSPCIDIILSEIKSDFMDVLPFYKKNGNEEEDGERQNQNDGFSFGV